MFCLDTHTVRLPVRFDGKSALLNSRWQITDPGMPDRSETDLSNDSRTKKNVRPFCWLEVDCGLTVFRHDAGCSMSKYNQLAKYI
jgi:hypothetical protein